MENTRWAANLVESNPEARGRLAGAQLGVGWRLGRVCQSALERNLAEI